MGLVDDVKGFVGDTVDAAKQKAEAAKFETNVQTVMMGGGVSRAVAESLLHSTGNDVAALQGFSNVNDAAFGKMSPQNAAARDQLTSLVKKNPEVAGQLAAAYKKDPTTYGRTLDGFVTTANAHPGFADNTVAALSGQLTPKGEANIYSRHVTGYLADPTLLQNRMAYDKTRMAAPAAPAPVSPSASSPANVVIAPPPPKKEKPSAPVPAQKGKKVNFLAENKKSVAAKASKPTRPEDVLCTADTDPSTGLAAPLGADDFLETALATGGPTGTAAAVGTVAGSVLSTKTGAPPPPPSSSDLTSGEALTLFNQTLAANPEFERLLKDKGAEQGVLAILQKDPNAAKNLKNPDKLTEYMAQLKDGKKDAFFNDLSGKNVQQTIAANQGMAGALGGLGNMINQFLPGMMDWVKGLGEMMTGLFSNLFSGLKEYFGSGPLAAQGTGNALNALLGGAQKIFEPHQPVTQVKHDKSGGVLSVSEKTMGDAQEDAAKRKPSLAGASQTTPGTNPKLDPFAPLPANATFDS